MDGFLISFERLRMHLRSLNDEQTHNEIILQCIFVVDLEDISIQSFVCQRSILAEIFVQLHDRTLRC
jgi:hypothetical protein